MTTSMQNFSKIRRYLRITMFVTFIIAALGSATVTAYAHGQQGDDCPKGSNDPDCKKK